MNLLFNSLCELKSTIFPVNSIQRVISAAMDAADPVSAVERNLHFTASQLTVGGKTYLLYPDSRIMVVAIGKAALQMGKSAVQQLKEKIYGGIIVCKHNPNEQRFCGKLEIVTGSHPVPDESSVIAAKKIKARLQDLNQHDILVLLISGGGSALVCLPANGISLNEIQSVTSSLVKSGASINEINTIRKHLDLIKGGGLAKMASPARMAALVISDVVNSPLDVIASGPAVADSSTFADSKAILEKYIPADRIPPAIMKRITEGCKGNIEETLKSNDSNFVDCDHTIIASNAISAQIALETAIEEGFEAELLTCELVGDARLAGNWLVETIKTKTINDKPYFGIAGGETTVQVKGNGLGGRNLEVALGAVRSLSNQQGCLLITFATDGEDGPTNAAGAYVTATTLDKGLDLGLEPESFLENNDAFHYFEKTGNLLITGPSGTNVNDLNFIVKMR